MSETNSVEQTVMPSAQPRLTVRLQSFPESNGKRNWTAMIVRVDQWDGLIGNCGGITVARGELWNRVAYEAECAKLLIGERDTEPCILDYGDDTDEILRGQGLEPANCRTDGGSLKLQMVLGALEHRDVMRKRLIRRSAAQLDKWALWYGNADHAARGQLPLPPAGDVQLAEDIREALGPNVGVEQ